MAITVVSVSNLRNFLEEQQHKGATAFRLMAAAALVFVLIDCACNALGAPSLSKYLLWTACSMGSMPSIMVPGIVLSQITLLMIAIAVTWRSNFHDILGKSLSAALDFGSRSEWTGRGNVALKLRRVAPAMFAAGAFFLLVHRAASSLPLITHTGMVPLILIELATVIAMSWLLLGLIKACRDRTILAPVIVITVVQVVGFLATYSQPAIEYASAFQTSGYKGLESVIFLAALLSSLTTAARSEHVIEVDLEAGPPWKFHTYDPTGVSFSFPFHIKLRQGKFKVIAFRMQRSRASYQAIDLNHAAQLLPAHDHYIVLWNISAIETALSENYKVTDSGNLVEFKNRCSCMAATAAYEIAKIKQFSLEAVALATDILIKNEKLTELVHRAIGRG